jgi:hypothetical protein
MSHADQLEQTLLRAEARALQGRAARFRRAADAKELLRRFQRRDCCGQIYCDLPRRGP